MRNKLNQLCLSILIPASLILAVQWQQDSAPFEFPSSIGVKSLEIAPKPLSFSFRQLAGKKQILLEYTLPMGAKESIIDIYTISGIRVGSLRLQPKSTSCLWDGSALKGSGTYTAVLKAGFAKKTIRFVIAN